MSHKDLFPLDSNDCIGSVIIFLGLVIATSGGIGGGGIIVPVLLLFFNFDSRHAIPLSNITIFGASIVNLLFNARKQHPLRKESLIDWDAVLVMEPLTMIGAIVGSLLNRLLPSWLILSSLDLILLLLAYKLLYKGIMDFKKESVLILEKSLKPHANDFEINNEVERTENGDNLGHSHFQQLADGGHSDKDGDDRNCTNSASGAGCALFLHESASSKLIPFVPMSTESSEVSSTLQVQDRHSQYSSVSSDETSIVSYFDSSASSLMHYTEVGPSVNDPSRDASDRSCGSFEIDSIEDLTEKDREQRSNRVCSYTQNGSYYGQVDAQHSTETSGCLSREGGWTALSQLNKPITKHLWISTLFLVIIFLNLAKCVGSETLYWGINGAMLASVTLSTTLAGLLLHVTWKKGAGAGSGAGTQAGHGHASASQSSQTGGIQWSLSNTIFCPVLCIFAGIFAGIWGIGGGFIKGPLLLYLAAHPMAAAATSATMIFFTSLVATTSFFAFGDILWDYSAFMFCLGAAATVVGQTVGSWAISQGSRSSIVPLSMGSVMLLSALLVTVETLNFQYHSYLSPAPHNRNSLQFPPSFSDLCSTGRE